MKQLREDKSAWKRVLYNSVYVSHCESTYLWLSFLASVCEKKRYDAALSGRLLDGANWSAASAPRFCVWTLSGKCWYEEQDRRDGKFKTLSVAFSIIHYLPQIWNNRNILLFMLNLKTSEWLLDKLVSHITTQKSRTVKTRMMGSIVKHVETMAYVLMTTPR